MDNSLFGISDPFEYAKKLDREYQRLSTAIKNNSKLDQKDHALNFSSAAWHLADRVYNYPETQCALDKIGIKDFEAYRNRIYRLCPELKICYDVAISYKHYNRSPAKTVKAASQVSVGGIAKINGIPVSQIAKISSVPISKIAKFNGIKISGTNKLIVSLTDGTELNFINIAKAVNSFWQKELESLSP